MHTIMNVPAQLKYTKDHEWIKAEGDIAWIGVTDHAQHELGDIVFIEVETVGETLARHDSFGTIEAVKTVSDMFMPVGGEVLEFNEGLTSKPETINQDPYGEGWVVKVRMTQPSELDDLLDSAAYSALIG